MSSPSMTAFSWTGDGRTMSITYSADPSTYTGLCVSTGSPNYPADLKVSDWAWYSTGNTITYTVPSYNTTYYFSLYSFTNSNMSTEVGHSGVANRTTGSPPAIIPSAPTNISAIKQGTTTGYVSFTKGTNATSTRIYLYNYNTGGYVNDYSTTNSYVNISGLSYNTRYYVTLYSVSSTGDTSSTVGTSKTYNFTTDDLPTCPTPSSASFATNLTYDRVDITYPTYSPYTIVNQYSTDGTNWNSTTSSNYPLSTLWGIAGKTLYIRSKCTHSSYYDSSWSSTATYSSPTCPTPSAPTLSADSTNVNITYPSNANYTTYSEYSVDLATTWSQATSSTYPLNSLDVASGKKIYVRSKYQRAYHYDGNWSTNGTYQESTCPTPTDISAVYDSVNNEFDITVNTVVGYTTRIYHKPNASPDWIWIGDYVSASTVTCSLDMSGFASGSTFYFRAVNIKSHYFDSNNLDSTQYTFTLPSCPDPTSLTATVNSSGMVTVTASATSGYNIYVEYYDGCWTWLGTQLTSFSDSTLNMSSKTAGWVLQLRAKCTQSGKTDSNYISYNLTINVRPSNWTLFNYAIGQDMGSPNQNLVKTGATTYTCDAIVMSASTWNDFTAKINKFRAYYDVKNSTSIGQYTFTPVAPATVFTATIFNQAISAINDMIATGLTAKTSGVSIIDASSFVTLQTKLNSIP